MKKLLFGLIATVMFFEISSAQENKIISGKISSGTTTSDLPLELKSALTYKINSQEFTTHQHYDKGLNGNITIIVDSKNLIVGITLPLDTSTEKIASIGKCLKNSFWGNGSGWDGFWDCISGS